MPKNDEQTTSTEVTPEQILEITMAVDFDVLAQKQREYEQSFLARHRDITKLIESRMSF